MTSSSELHHWASRWQGNDAETEEYLGRIAAWRDAWRPEEVRILLVAESHVAEREGDLAVTVSAPTGVNVDLPQGYCRLVYCLGYGEKSLCSLPPDGQGQTWQFWDIFGAVVGGVDNSLPRAADSTTAQRLAWKVQTLKLMRERGIWLVDASVAAIYLGRGRRIPTRQSAKMLRESFERFVWPDVKDEPIEQVWVIGKGVGDALRGHPAIRADRVISQPRDRNRERYLEGLRRMADSILGDRSEALRVASHAEPPTLSPFERLLVALNTLAMVLTLIAIPVQLAVCVLEMAGLGEEPDDRAGCGCGCRGCSSWVVVATVMLITAICCCGVGGEPTTVQPSPVDSRSPVGAFTPADTLRTRNRERTRSSMRIGEPSERPRTAW